MPESTKELSVTDRWTDRPTLIIEWPHFKKENRKSM